jgi:hypothetical protein
MAEEITKNTLRRLANAVGKEELEVRDSRCAGLSVRVRARGAVWTLRGRLLGKQSTWRIGSIADGELQEPKEARRRAEEAKRLLGRGVDPSDWLRGCLEIHPERYNSLKMQR